MSESTVCKLVGRWRPFRFIAFTVKKETALPFYFTLRLYNSRYSFGTEDSIKVKYFKKLHFNDDGRMTGWQDGRMAGWHR
jgi:hypothetical protein